MVVIFNVQFYLLCEKTKYLKFKFIFLFINKLFKYVGILIFLFAQQFKNYGQLLYLYYI